MVEFIDPITNNELNYYIEPKLLRYLETKVKIDLSKKDKDYVIIVDGYEGSGKSTFAQQIAKFVDPTLDLSMVCMTSNEFKKAIITAKPNQCVIYDEAVTGMTAGDTITRIGKLLKSMMMQMRQKNLFVIVIIPTIFELGKYTVLSRAKSFFHIYESKGRRGYFVGYNRKDLRNLYLFGRKNYSYKVRSHFTGRFYSKYVINEEEYRKKKADALFAIDDEHETKEKDSKYLKERNLMICDKYNQPEFNTILKLTAELKRIGLELSKSQVGNIVKNGGKAVKIHPSNDENII